MSPRSRPPSALWLIKKPRGITSFEALKQFRTPLEGPWPLKMVHGGVLDPFAEGLLIVLVGSATKLFERLHEVPKRYVGEVKWGAETDTGDGQGRVVETSAATPPPLDELNEALQRFIGWTQQVPPATSNKRIDGERAYEKAHRGEPVELSAQPVYLHAANLRPHDEPDRAWVDLTVRGGFYVRSLVRDFARSVGQRAHLLTLERTAIGPWSTPVAPRQLTGREVLPWLASYDLTDDEWGRLKRGERLQLMRVKSPEWPLPDGFPPSGWVRLFHLGKLVAMQHPVEATALLAGGI